MHTHALGIHCACLMPQKRTVEVVQQAKCRPPAKHTHTMGSKEVPKMNYQIIVENTVSWDVAQCSRVQIDRRFRSDNCLHHQGVETFNVISPILNLIYSVISAVKFSIVET